jgi:GTP cyclohydrolase I
MIEEIRSILKQIGEDITRDGLVNTPQRVDRAFRFLTSGYRMDPDELLNKALFDVAYDEMVIVRDIELFSLCEHHLLPFFGKCHVGYIPNGRVIGLSKIPRLVDMYARRLQVQERLTTQIAETINSKIHPRGVAVVIEAHRPRWPHWMRSRAAWWSDWAAVRLQRFSFGSLAPEYREA